MRAPALQTLLLYAKSLDTNSDCTRILCDNWLEIKFLDTETAQKLISAILNLRSSIDKLFKIRLEDRLKMFETKTEDSSEQVDSELEEKSSRHDSYDSKSDKEKAKNLERILKKKLSEFLDASVMYSLRRVLPAEVETFYVKKFNKDESVEDKELANLENKKLKNDFLKHSENKLEVNESKGGFRITDYLTYNW
jgi:hypothetical protein